MSNTPKCQHPGRLFAPKVAQPDPPKEEQRTIEILKGMCCTGYADRDPILSDDDIYTLANPEQEMGAVCARRYYEERITSGELMVVKTVKLGEGSKYLDGGIETAYLVHDDCPGGFMEISFDAIHCPGCGAKIIP